MFHADAHDKISEINKAREEKLQPHNTNELKIAEVLSSVGKTEECM